MGAAALPTGTGEHRGDDVLQPPCFRRGRLWWASEVTTSTSLSPRAVSKRRRASQRGLAQKTLHHFFRMKAPGRHRAGRTAIAWPFIYPGLPSCGAGGAGLLGPGVCGLGGADTLNIECSLGPDCTCIVPLRVSSPADEGDSTQHSFRTTGFQPCPPLTAAPRWRVEWLGRASHSRLLEWAP